MIVHRLGILIKSTPLNVGFLWFSFVICGPFIGKATRSSVDHLGLGALGRCRARRFSRSTTRRASHGVAAAGGGAGRPGGGELCAPVQHLRQVRVRVVHLGCTTGESWLWFNDETMVDSLQINDNKSSIWYDLV